MAVSAEFWQSLQASSAIIKTMIKKVADRIADLTVKLRRPGDDFPTNQSLHGQWGGIWKWVTHVVCTAVPWRWWTWAQFSRLLNSQDKRIEKNLHFSHALSQCLHLMWLKKARTDSSHMDCTRSFSHARMALHQAWRWLRSSKWVAP